jgi:PhnB protein
LTVDLQADAERVYALLADGGEIFMKMEKTPFANRFAMLRDKFGTSWMLLHQPEAA